jgi:ligand-binding sensor domain-containing protein/signal transduction histidine kinase
MKKVLFIGVLLLTGWGSRAQFNPAFFDQLSVDDGLSQSEVFCVLNDRRGFVWLGTQDGLNRYDGTRFTHFKHDPFDASTLSNDRILALFEDATGTLWVGTENGLNRYDALRGRFVRLRQTLKTRSRPLVVRAIRADRSGTLWLATNQGLHRLLPDPTGPDGYRLRSYAVNGPGDFRANVVNSLLFDHTGTLWVGTLNGLYRARVLNPAAPPRRQTIRVEPTLNPAQPKFWLPSPNVRALAEDRFGTLWVGTERGLARVNPRTLSILVQPEVTAALSGAAVSSLLFDKTGLLWAGTWSQGIRRFAVPGADSARLLDGFQEELLGKKGLKSNFINVLYEGADPQEDLVWIGTHNAGAHLFSRAKNSFRQWTLLTDRDQSSAINLVFALTTDRQGDLWVGTQGGLLRINRQTRAVQRYRAGTSGLRTDEVYALLETSDGTLWVGTTGGLHRFDRDHNRFEWRDLDGMPAYADAKKPGMAERVHSLYEDAYHHLWVGTGNSLKRIEAGTGRVTAYSHNPADSTSLRPFLVEALREDDRGNLWVGTAYGLNKLDLRTNRATFFRNDPANPGSLIGNQVLDIRRDRRGRLWFCSDKGLSLLRTERGRDRFEHFTEKNGLPNGMVYGALEGDRGRLWLSTNLGLSCFDPEKRSFRNFDLNDGLAGNEFNMGAFHRSPDGELFFGGIGVVVSFRPDRMVENRHRPRVVLTSFRKFDQPVNVDSLLARRGTLELAHHENVFTVEFAALDFTSPLKNQYAYRLEGLNPTWMAIGTRRFVSFANLPPGEYVLAVKGSNGNGLWNDAEPLRIPLLIRPPFWQTGWFYALAVLASGLVAWLFYNYRVRKKVRHLLELERVALQENERVRKMAAQDLHDEFGNTITRISMLTELIKARLNGHGEEIAPLLTKISDNSNRLYQGTKDFIWAINPEHDNFYEIAIRLKDFGDDIFDKTGLSFQAHGIADSLRAAVLPMGVSRHLIFLFKEAMSNTLKHARASHAEIRFAATPAQVEVTWTDNGVGFERLATSPGNGLQNIRSRAQKIGGTVDVFTQSDGGTTIRFRMPVTVPQNG